MFSFLKHLLIPHEKNNHRAKILHNFSLFVMILALLSLSSVFTYVNTNSPEILEISYSISETELLDLINNEREARGLSALSINPELSDAARRKAADMFDKNYWAHFAPDGSSTPWDFIRASGYDYVYAGENLAKGFTNSSSTVDAWMNSDTHRDNILSNKYKDIGFAIVTGNLIGEETVLIVEIFGARDISFIASDSEAGPSGELAVLTENNNIQAAVEEVEKESGPIGSLIITNPTLDINSNSKAISLVGFSFLAFAFIMDLAIVERKKIPRLVGHNLDHIMLILMFILFIVLAKGGVIL